MEKKIFISYSHQDNQCAKGIARFLQRQNYNVWIDVENLEIGKSWASNIQEAQKSADTFIAILSKNSIRRKEVLKEIAFALEKKDKSPNYQVLFIVIGNLHPSWFVCDETCISDKIINYLQTVQFIQLDAKGTINISSMENLIRALNGKMIYSNKKNFIDTNEYIYESGIPQKKYDSIADNIFYQVHSSDLAPSTVFPFALDNQWLPASMSLELKKEFKENGFESEKVEKFVETFQKKNLFLSLINSRQVLLNRAAAINSQCLQKYYCHENSYEPSEKQAFINLLQNGSIILFLYGDDERTPYFSKSPKYATKQYCIDAWNQLCKNTKIHCIRENWEKPLDVHKYNLVKQCLSLAYDIEINEILADCFGFNQNQKQQFFDVLKEIDMTVFLKTHIVGTGHRSEVRGFTRTDFYKNFVVIQESSNHPAPVLNCNYDPDKPFHEVLKKIIDIYYNSLFANHFNCSALIPNDISPEDTFIHQMYLNHGIKEVSPDELEYAFSEFFQNETILDKIKEFGDSLFIHHWNLEKIVQLRHGIHWREYIELMEYIIERSTYWSIDFSDIEKLIELFFRSIEEFKTMKNNENFTPAYTFRICIGSKVLDIICTEKIKKLKSYPGNFYAESQNIMIIQFIMGDTTSNIYKISDSIFPALKIFDGKTNHTGGEEYFKEISKFLIEHCGFVLMS